MVGKACILKDFFFDMSPIIALREAKIVYNFGLSECNRVKRKILVLLKDIFLQYRYLLIVFTVKSRYMHSEKKKSFQKKKKVSYLPTLIFFRL